jgi:hypothetical protein
MAFETGQRGERIRAMGREVLTTPVSRVSWGAIFAGAACALALQAMFTLLTVGLGLSLVDDGDPSGAGWGSGLFFAITLIISLFAGGWIAGRLSGVPRMPSALLHGVVMWALVTLAAAWLSVSATGALLSGATRAVSTAGSAAGSVVGSTAQGIGGAVSAVMPELEDLQVQDLRSLVPDSVEQDVRELVGDQDLTPQQIGQEVRSITSAVIDDGELRSARRIIVNAGRQMVRNPAQADEIFQQAVDRLTQEDGPLGEQQFDELQGQLEQRYDIPEERSTEIVQRWREEFVQTRDAAVQTYRETYDTVAQELNDAADAATEAAQQAASATATAAWWSAFGVFLALLAAAAGAAMGRPDREVTERMA